MPSISKDLIDYKETNGRGVSRVLKANFNRLTRVSNVEPYAYEDE